MAQPFVPGPINIWVGLGNNFAPLHLGLSEKGVDLQKNPVFSNYDVDIAGVELDKVYRGTLASISFTLTYWNEATLAIASDYAGTGVVDGSTRGVDAPGEIGTLMGFENQAYPVWLPFPYKAKAQYLNQPAGYHFFLAYIDKETLPELGARPSKVNLTMTCLRKLDMTVSNAFGYGKLSLYDHDMTAIQGLVPV